METDDAAAEGEDVDMRRMERTWTWGGWGERGHREDGDMDKPSTATEPSSAAADGAVDRSADAGTVLLEELVLPSHMYTLLYKYNDSIRRMNAAITHVPFTINFFLAKDGVSWENSGITLRFSLSEPARILGQ